MKQVGFFDIDDRLERVSALGDPLEVMASVIDFEAFRPFLDQGSRDLIAARAGVHRLTLF